MAVSREEIKRAVDAVPDACLQDLAEYLKWLRETEETLTPHELAEVKEGRTAIERGEGVGFDELRRRWQV